MIKDLIADLRASGMVLWVEDGRIRGRMRDGGKIPYNIRLMAEELKAAGMVAVAALEEAYTLRGIAPDEAFSLGEAIKRGETLLVGKVIYHQSTGLFDLKFVPLEVGAIR